MLSVTGWRTGFIRRDAGTSPRSSTSSPRRYRYRRQRQQHSYLGPRCGAVLFVAVCLLSSACTLAQQVAVNCCSGPEMDCSNGSVERHGMRYYCMNVMDSPEMRACVSCIPMISSSSSSSGGGDDDVKCSYCCGTPNTECDLEWSWGAVLATLSVSAVFATCSGLLALAEKRRKRKGMSLARAWSIPHGMPVLRATVVDLSDAVRGRASIWSVEGLNGEEAADDELLEHVGLLEEIPNDSIYGALVHQRESDIPVAKLAEDSWVTAMAWRQQAAVTAAAPNPNPNPVTYGGSGGSGGGGHRSSGQGGRGHEGLAAGGGEDSPSSSRWRSARATARQARRVNSIGGSGGSGGGSATAYTNQLPSAVSPSDRSSGGAVGGAGIGWERPSSVVVIGDLSEREESREEDEPR
ncbi:unnamed protein product [Scytosiphon promiscuus]